VKPGRRPHIAQHMAEQADGYFEAIAFSVTFYLLRESKTLKRWSWREELNLQPAVYKTAALPLSYASRLSCCIVRSTDPEESF
jgi:hypothetical protein